IPGVEIVAVCSRDRERALDFICHHNLTHAAAYDDLAKFLKHRGMDIVSICSPHPQHPAQTIAAANAGKHIVIEKPVALNPKDLAAMVAAVKRNRVKT